MRSIKRIISKPNNTLRFFEKNAQISKEIYSEFEGYLCRNLRFDEFLNPVSNWVSNIKLENSEKAIYYCDSQHWYALAKPNQAPVATISLFQKSNQTAWGGYYYIVESLRGTSLASQLFNSAVLKVEQEGIRKITFHCFPPLQRLYKSYGFETLFFDAMNNAQISESIDPPIQTPLYFSPPILKTIFTYDKKVQNGLDRSEFLGHWLLKPETQTLVALNDQEEVLGYSVLSPFYFESKEMGNHHVRIAPLYADSPEIAERLLNSSLSCAFAFHPKKTAEGKTSVFFDNDGGNPHAAELLRKVGLFKQLTPLARMSRLAPNSAEPPAYYDNSKVYGISEYASGP